MEVTDTTQTPAVPESPESPGPEIPPQPDAPPDESMLPAEIAQLWQIHNDFKTSLLQQSQNLQSLRAELGKKLAAMKALLAKPGRAGQWSAWLKEHKIARATADRLVLKFERSVNPDRNCLNESISEPTEEEIQTLLEKIAPKLRRVLRTPASTYRFIDLLASSFEGVDRRDVEQGFVVLRPAQQTAVADSTPAECPLESASLVPNSLPEGSAESIGTPAVL